MSLYKNSFNASILTASLAATSYGLIATLTRLFSSEEVADLLVLWTSINIAILVCQFPIEAYAPKLLTELKSTGEENLLSPMIAAFIMAIGVILACGSVAVSLLVNPSLLMEVIAVAVFILTQSVFLWQRALLFSRGDFSLLVQKSFIVLGSAAVFFSLLLLVDVQQPFWTFYAIALSYFLPIVFRSRGDCQRLWAMRNDYRQAVARLRTRSARIELSSLMFTNTVSLLLLNGGVIMANALGADDKALVTYSSTISLTLVPFMMLNSLTFPILLQGVRQVEGGDLHGFRRSYWRTISFFTASVLVVAVALAFVGNTALAVFVGSEYQASRLHFFWVSIASGTVVITGVPRLLMVALGRISPFNKFLVSSLLVYFGVVFLTTDTIAAVISASILASVPLLIFGTSVIWRFTRATVSTADVN